jgi:hypothetical protein
MQEDFMRIRSATLLAAPGTEPPRALAAAAVFAFAFADSKARCRFA